MIPVYRPFLTKELTQYAHQAIDSTWVSSKGKFCNLAEIELSRMYYSYEFEKKNALLTSNGTTATHLLAKVLKKQFPKVKKIIVANNVYVAAWNSFLYDKEYELIPIEANLETWNIDQKILYETIDKYPIEEIAFLAVHSVGNIINVPKIKQDYPNLIVLEDNCEGFLGTYDDMYTGTASYAFSVSFFGNKNLTAGEGGAIFVPTSQLQYVTKLRGQGQSNQKFIHDELGYNYRLTNVQAALLYGQLLHKNTILESKQNIFSKYRNLLSGFVEFQKTDPGTEISYWMFGVRVPGANYLDIESYMRNNLIEVRPMFYPINKHKHLSNYQSVGGTKIAEQISKECVILPSYPDLQDHEIMHIVNCLKQFKQNMTNA